MEAKTCICVWLDETSDATRPTWVVSRDRLDDSGGAETTDTLSAHATEADAVAAAEEAGRALGLPVVRS